MIHSSIKQGVILLSVSALFAFGYNAVRDESLPLIAMKKVFEKAGIGDIGEIIATDTLSIYPVFKEIDLETAKKLWDRGITFIDARSEEDFRKGHIVGAVNLSVVEVAQRYPLEEPIVTYCSGEGCEESIIFGESLADWGFLRIFIFHGGWPEWVAAGYPSEGVQ